MTDQVTNPISRFVRNMLANSVFLRVSRLEIMSLFFLCSFLGYADLATAATQKNSGSFMQWLSGFSSKPSANKGLVKPNLSDEDLEQWASQAISAIYNFNYTTWQQDLEKDSQYFSKEGWIRYQNAFSTQMLPGVIENKQQVSSTVTQPPKITKQGLENDVYPEPRYAWQIVTVMNTKFVGEKNDEKNLKVTMTVIRVPREEAPSSVGIDQIIVEEIL